MGRRTILAIAGWLVAAVAATVTGLAAVQVIGAGLTDPAGEVRDADEVARLAAAPATPPPGWPARSGTPDPSGAAAPTGSAATEGFGGPSTDPSPTGPTGVPESRRALPTPGGTVVAQCQGSDVLLVSWTPAQGYRVEDVDPGPDDDAELTFRGSGYKIDVEVRCTDGQPVATSERDADD